MRTKKGRNIDSAVMRADRVLDAELQKQVALIYSSTAIALRRYWGWGKPRILSLLEMTSEVWHECGQTNLKSMPQMLEEETGVEVQMGDGKSWHDLAFLNAGVTNYDKGMTRPQYIYMRKQQAKWLPANVTACILLALHRRCGFGPVRLSRVASQTDGVLVEYGRNKDAIRAACINEVGLSVIDHLAETEIVYAEN